MSFSIVSIGIVTMIETMLDCAWFGTNTQIDTVFRRLEYLGIRSRDHGSVSAGNSVARRNAARIGRRLSCDRRGLERTHHRVGRSAGVRTQREGVPRPLPE